jgi:hypothetical protein
MAMAVILIGVPKDVAGVPKNVPAVPKKVARAGPFPTLYDDFHGAQIDPGRWRTSGANGYELSRGLDQTVGRLTMSMQAYGNVASSGPLLFGAGRNNLFMVNASAAAALGIQVTTRIDDVDVTGCASTDPGRALTGLAAELFRDGPNPPNPNDYTGIVEAFIQLVVFANQADQTVAGVRFFADRCLNFNCDADVFLGGGSFLDVPVGQDATLGIELVPDPIPANTKIIFTKDAEPAQVVPNVAQNQTNTNLGILHDKWSRLRVHLETCPTRAQGFIKASYENFRTTP